MANEPYPHSRDDCDCCGEYDADLAAHYDGLEGRDPLWCQRCAGQLLARLVLTGHTVSVYAPDGLVSNAAGIENGPVPWTVDLAEEALRLAQPSGSTFLRALIDEGGTATAKRLKERTGSDTLHYMTSTLNAAVRKVAGRRRLGERPQLARPRRDPANPGKEVVYDYELPEDLVLIFDEALRRLGR